MDTSSSPSSGGTNIGLFTSSSSVLPDRDASGSVITMDISSLSSLEDNEGIVINSMWYAEFLGMVGLAVG